MMPYSSPTTLASISRVAQGDVVDLWASGSGSEYPYLTSASISLNANALATLAVSLEMPFDKGVEMMEDGVFDVGNVLQVRMGYSLQGTWTPWYYGLMLDPQITIDAAGVTATLTASPTAMVERLSAVRRWSDVSAKDVVLDVLHSYGFYIAFTGDTTEFTKVRSVVEQGGVTDWELVRTLLLELGLHFYFGTDANGGACCFIKPQADVHAEEPIRTYRMRGGFDVEKSTYPLLSFDSSDPSGKGLWLPAVTRGIVSSDIDRDTKEIVTTSADETTSEVKSTASRTLWGRLGTLFSRDGDSGLIPFRGVEDEDHEAGKYVAVPLGEDADEVQRTLQSKFDESRVLGGIKATLSTVGNPFQLPLEVVQVDGIGKRLTGLYVVQSVQQEMSAGEWTTSMEAISEGYSADSDIGEEADDVNTAEPSDSAESAPTDVGE